jgi:hypothetical protein
VDPIPDPLLLRKSASAGNRTQTTGSVAKNSDHYTSEMVASTPKKKSEVKVKEINTTAYCDKSALSLEG